MDSEFIKSLENKEEKTEIDWAFLKANKTLSVISEILVEESKFNCYRRN